MKLKIEFEDGNTLLLDNVRRLEMDAVDNEVTDDVEIPEFIQKKIDKTE